MPSNMEDCPTKNSIFGATSRRKPVEFVPAAVETLLDKVPERPSGSVEREYLSIVLKASPPTTGHASATASHHSGSTINESAKPASKPRSICEVCNLPIREENETSAVIATPHHDLSLMHQMCLQHSYPPSHLDRSRKGLKYMSSYGWDPDERLGLGAHGGGRKAPIKAISKHDTVGLGALIPPSKAKSKKTELLDAGKVRKKEKEDRKKTVKLQELFYQDEDVEKYLGNS